MRSMILGLFVFLSVAPITALAEGHPTSRPVESRDSMIQLTPGMTVVLQPFERAVVRCGGHAQYPGLPVCTVKKIGQWSYQVYAGSNLVETLDSLTRALEIVTWSKENGFCETETHALPVCEVNKTASWNYDVRIGQETIETLESLARAVEIVAKLRNVGLCR